MAVALVLEKQASKKLKLYSNKQLAMYYHVVVPCPVIRLIFFQLTYLVTCIMAQFLSDATPPRHKQYREYLRNSISSVPCSTLWRLPLESVPVDAIVSKVCYFHQQLSLLATLFSLTVFYCPISNHISTFIVVYLAISSCQLYLAISFI